MHVTFLPDNVGGRLFLTDKTNEMVTYRVGEGFIQWCEMHGVSFVAPDLVLFPTSGIKCVIFPDDATACLFKLRWL